MRIGESSEKLFGKNKYIFSKLRCVRLVFTTFRHMKNGTVHSTYLFHKKKRPGLNPASLALPGYTNKSSDSQEKDVIDSTGT